MVWILYNVLFFFGFIILLPFYLLRMRRRGGYARDFAQRLGRYSGETLAKLRERPRIWMHAVSVGELFIALKMMEELRPRCPGVGFALTVNTSTAHAIARKQLAADDVLLYFPADFPLIVRRALHAINPLALVIMECELWPNLARLTAARGVPLFLVNGRISDNSFKGYSKLRALTRRVLSLFARVLVQSERDRDRVEFLGARPDAVRVMGTAKYDVSDTVADPAAARAVLRAVGLGENSTILLGGSTWPGEEAALADAYLHLRAKHPDLALVICPRHVERGEGIIAELEEKGLRVVRKTTVQTDAEGTLNRDQVLLVDTTGELRNFYACADIIFVGKSLTAKGGQNPAEPAAFGRPIVVGPNMENFPVVMRDLTAAAACVQVSDAAGLEVVLDRLAGDGEERQRLGKLAANVVESGRGVIAASAMQIADDLCARGIVGAS